MADLVVVRKGIEGRLKTILPLINTSHTVPDAATVPMAYVGLPTNPNAQIVEYDRSFGNGTAIWQLTVTVIVIKWDAGVGQDLLDPFLGNDSTNTSSVYWAIMNDRTLGGAVSDTVVKDVNSYGSHRVGGVNYAGAKWSVEVLTSP